MFSKLLATEIGPAQFCTLEILGKWYDTEIPTIGVYAPPPTWAKRAGVRMKNEAVHRKFMLRA